jgi:hypothetical protein
MGVELSSLIHHSTNLLNLLGKEQNNDQPLFIR